MKYPFNRGAGHFGSHSHCGGVAHDLGGLADVEVIYLGGGELPPCRGEPPRIGIFSDGAETEIPGGRWSYGWYEPDAYCYDGYPLHGAEQEREFPSATAALAAAKADPRVTRRIEVGMVVTGDWPNGRRTVAALVEDGKTEILMGGEPIEEVWSSLRMSHDTRCSVEARWAEALAAAHAAGWDPQVSRRNAAGSIVWTPPFIVAAALRRAAGAAAVNTAMRAIPDKDRGDGLFFLLSGEDNALRLVGEPTKMAKQLVAFASLVGEVDRLGSEAA